MCEKLFVENNRGHCCRNFAKLEFWKLEHVKLFLVKHNLILGAGYNNKENNIFPFRDILSSDF